MSAIDRPMRKCEHPHIPMKRKTSSRLAHFASGQAAKGVAWVLIGLGIGLWGRIEIGRFEVKEDAESLPLGNVLFAAPSAKTEDGKNVPSQKVAETLAAFDPAPMMLDVLNAVGLDRYAKISRFLAGATAAECEALYKALDERNELSHHFMDMINLRWAEIDPLGALKDGSSAAVWAWAKSDPEAAFAYALEKDKSMAGEVLRAIAQDSAVEGEAMLHAHPELGQSTVWEGMVSALFETNPRAAAEYALAHGVDLDGTLKRWADTDPEGALEFALAQADPRDKAKSLDEVLGKIAQSDPARALAVIAELPPGGMRKNLQDDFLKRAARDDSAMATDWARALPFESERLNALRVVATEVCPRDPDQALGLLVETISLDANEDPFAGLGQYEDLGRALAVTRPVETMTALLASGAGAYASTQMAQFWVQTDPTQASTWIGRQPQGPQRDAMVTGMVNGMLQAGNPDFDSAAVWALWIPAPTPGDASDRQWPVLQQVFTQWLAHDRAAALAAMAHEGMPLQVRSMYKDEAETTP
jgi:hypothetical protein